MIHGTMKIKLYSLLFYVTKISIDVAISNEQLIGIDMEESL